MFLKLIRSWLLLSIVFIPPSLFAASARISFSVLSHDFGNVKRGEKVSQDFIFINQGDQALTITGVHASCGCAVANIQADKSYKPGEKGQLRVTLDTSNFAGPIVKTVTVMTNEKLTPTRNLTMKALVTEEVTAMPPVVDFGAVTAVGSQELEVSIKNQGLPSFNPKVSRYNTAALIVRTEIAKDEMKLFVKLHPEISAGFVKETILVQIPGAALKELAILVRADVNGSIAWSPTYLEFGSVKGHEVVVRDIKFTRQKSFKVQLSSAELNVNGVKIPDVETAQLISVDLLEDKATVKLSNIQNTNGSVHGKLTLLTDDPTQKQLNVDFYAFFNEKK